MPGDDRRNPSVARFTVKAQRRDAQAEVGQYFLKRDRGETLADGWRRAYREGWRCTRVVIRAWGA